MIKWPESYSCFALLINKVLIFIYISLIASTSQSTHSYENGDQMFKWYKNDRNDHSNESHPVILYTINQGCRNGKEMA